MSKFEQQANEVVAMLPWVKNVKVTMSAQPARPIYAEQLPAGLQTISNIVAVSSCKVDLCGRFSFILYWSCYIKLFAIIWDYFLAIFFSFTLPLIPADKRLCSI